MVIIAVYFVVVLGIGMYLRTTAPVARTSSWGRGDDRLGGGVELNFRQPGAIETDSAGPASAYEYGILAAHAIGLQLPRHRPSWPW